MTAVNADQPGLSQNTIAAEGGADVGFRDVQYLRQ